MSESMPNSPAETTGADACESAGKVGAEHEVLKSFEGDWIAGVTFWMQPGA